MQDYWTGDVSGLYVIKGADGEPIELIDIRTAKADAQPISDTKVLKELEPTKSGYYFISLHPAGEVDGKHPDKFAVCAYPAEYGVTGIYTFIINEQDTVYQKDLGLSGNIKAYPADPIAEGWEEVE